eukprot:UN27831
MGILIAKLRSGQATESVVKTLAVELRSCDHGKIMEFLSETGLSLLVQAKKDNSRSTRGFEIAFLACFRAVLVSRGNGGDEKNGVDHIIAHDTCLTAIVDLMGSEDTRVMGDVCEILITLAEIIMRDYCDEDAALDRISEVLNEYSERKGYDSMWKPFTKLQTQQDFQLRRKVSKMIIYVLTVFDIEDRVFFRNELLHQGFVNMLERVREESQMLPEVERDAINEEIELYWSGLEEDNNECILEN